MPDQPKPRAFMVSLVLDGGPISQTALVAPDMPNAVALCAFMAGRDPNMTGELTGCAALELTPEWLRRSLRMLEEGKATGDVVSLVSDNLRFAPPQPAPGPAGGEDKHAVAWAHYSQQLQQAGLCPRHPQANTIGGVCPLCQPSPFGGAA